MLTEGFSTKPTTKTTTATKAITAPTTSYNINHQPTGAVVDDFKVVFLYGNKWSIIKTDEERQAEIIRLLL